MAQDPVGPWRENLEARVRDLAEEIKGADREKLSQFDKVPDELIYDGIARHLAWLLLEEIGVDGMCGCLLCQN